MVEIASYQPVMAGQPIIVKTIRKVVGEYITGTQHDNDLLKAFAYDLLIEVDRIYSNRDALPD